MATRQRRAESRKRSGRTTYQPQPTLGFACAVNLAISTAWDGESDVLLLNPDARIDPADVDRLQTALHAAPSCAAVGPRLVGDSGGAQAADWPMPSPLHVWLDAFALVRFSRGMRFVTGAVLMLNGSAIKELGGMDERYFLYAEESDWQLAAQRAGWSVAVVDDATAWHAGAASSSNPVLRERLFEQSANLFAWKWYGRRGWLIMRSGRVVAALRRLLVGPPEARRTARRALSVLLRPMPSAGKLEKAEAVNPRSVAHVVSTNAFAGVERYVADAAGT